MGGGMGKDEVGGDLTGEEEVGRMGKDEGRRQTTLDRRQKGAFL
jgi:hypothetical protein